MWELENKEDWEPKNRCFWTVLLEKILESPLDCKEIKTVNLKGNQSWIFIRRTDAESPIRWPPDMKNWLIRKVSDAEKYQRQGEKWTTGDKRGWDGWVASQTQWTWVWVNSGSWWWTGKPDMLQSKRSQRVGHHWVTELNWNDLIKAHICYFISEGQKSSPDLAECLSQGLNLVLAGTMISSQGSTEESLAFKLMQLLAKFSSWCPV